MKSRMQVSRCCCVEAPLPVASDDARWRSGQAFYRVLNADWIHLDQSTGDPGTARFGRTFQNLGPGNTIDGWVYSSLHQRVNVAQGATIGSAILDLLPSSTGGGLLTTIALPLRVWVWQGDTGEIDWNIFDVVAGASTAVPPSPPSPNWTLPTTGSWSTRLDVTLPSPPTAFTIDLTAQIQAVIDRAGWVAGNYVAIALATDYETAAYDGDKLWFSSAADSIDFSNPGAPVWSRNYLRVTL